MLNQHESYYALTSYAFFVPAWQNALIKVKPRTSFNRGCSYYRRAVRGQKAMETFPAAAVAGLILHSRLSANHNSQRLPTSVTYYLI